MTRPLRPTIVRLLAGLLPLVLLAACAGDGGTAPDLAGLAVPSGDDADVGSLAPGGDDPVDEPWIDGEEGPLEFDLRAGAVKLRVRFDGKVRAREPVDVTVRASARGGSAVRGKLEIDFGDGRPRRTGRIERKLETTVTYREEGTYRIFVVLRGDDGVTARAGFRVRVREPLRYSIDLEWDGSASPGVPETFQIRVAQMRLQERAEAGVLFIDYGDGDVATVSRFAGTIERTKTYRSAGDYVLTLTLQLRSGSKFVETYRVPVSDGGDDPGGGGGGGGGGEGDEIDPFSITYLHTSPASWPITSTINSVTISGAGICIDHTAAGRWPVEDGSEGNPWVVARIDGRWYAGTYEWLRPGQICKGVTRSNIGAHVKEPPLSGWVPRSGEEVYFFVSTNARFGAGRSPQRSNMVRVVWP